MDLLPTLLSCCCMCPCSAESCVPGGWPGLGVPLCRTALQVTLLAGSVQPGTTPPSL